MSTLDGITLEEYPEIESMLYKGPDNITKIGPILNDDPSE